VTSVCFFRHGPAGTAGPRWPDDRLRPLTAAGKEATRVAAAGLATLFQADLVLTSPLVRAVQTAEIVARALKCRDLRQTEALITPDLSVLLAAIAESGAERVVAVGHEPDMSRAVSLCLTADPEAATVWMKKSGAALVHFPGAPSAGLGELEWHLAPRILRGLAPKR
jgi:phosphohistidine phosphatase